MAVRKRKLTVAKKSNFPPHRKKARKRYIKNRKKRLAYAKKYYRMHKARILKRRKRYHKLTKGVPFYKAGKPGGRWPRGKRFAYAKRRGGKRRKAA